MNVFPSKFRFFFEKDGERYLLKYSPEEWNDNVLNWSRSSDSVGVVVKYTTSFTFIKEDADYLRDVFKASGVFSDVKFIIEECNYDSFEYEPYYSSDIDFYSYENSKNKVSVITLDTSYKASIDANMDTTYEIDVPDTSDKVWYNRLSIISTTSLYATYDKNINSDNKKVTDVLYSVIVSQEEFDRSNVFQGTEQGSISSDNWFAKFSKATDVEMTVKFKIKSVNYNYAGTLTGFASSFSLYLKKGDEKHVIYTYESKDIPLIIPGGDETTITFRTNARRGDTVYICADIECQGHAESSGMISPVKMEVSAEMDLSTRYSYRSNNAVYIRGLRPVELLKELVSKATGGKYEKVKSSLLEQGEVSNMLITSGNLVRGIEGAKIKTSLKDFFQAFKSMFGGYHAFRVIDGEEVLEFEKVNHFYDRSTMIASVENIDDYSMKIKDSDIYNRLKIGYEDQTYDEINGKKEFNTTLEFSINSRHNGKELNLVSPYRADMYGIEFTIIDYDQQDTTDSDNDNDVFVIHTKPITLAGKVVGHQLNRDYKILNDDSYSGNSAFNVYLSPKRCLLRQVEYLKSLFMFSGNVLEFASSPKDYNVKSTGDIIEHDSVNLDDHDYLFKPVTHEFETMVPSGISSMLEENYRGYVSFTFNGQQFKGFIDSISENPGRNKSQKWKLLET